MSFYFNNIGEFRYKIKGNLPMEFGEESMLSTTHIIPLTLVHSEHDFYAKNLK